MVYVLILAIRTKFTKYNVIRNADKNYNADKI